MFIIRYKMTKDYDLILKEVKEINIKIKKYKNGTEYKGLTTEEFKSKMIVEHSYLSTFEPKIFSSAVDNKLDTAMFSYMIQKAKDITKNRISNLDATKDVGNKLANEFKLNK